MTKPLQISALNSFVPYRVLYKTITQSVYTVLPEDTNNMIIFNATTNATLNLPPVNKSEGMIINVWNNNTSTFTLTIDPHGAELINGVSTLVLEVNEATKCQAYQGRWFTRIINASDLYASAVIAGSAKQSVVSYNGTTLTAGAFDGGSNNPSSTTRLNYNGNFYATNLFGIGSNLTALNATQLTTGTVPGDRGVTSGSASPSFVEYNGTTATSGQFDGGTTNPSGTTRLNYSGYFYATRFYGEFNGDGTLLSNVTDEFARTLSTLSL